jgi:hypothetical protein
MLYIDMYMHIDMYIYTYVCLYIFMYILIYVGKGIFLQYIYVYIKYVYSEFSVILI